MVRYLSSVVGALVLGMCGSEARASLSAFLTSTGDGKTWNYTLRFVPSVPGETLTAGDFVTIYDYIPAFTTIISASSPGWASSTQGVGPTPSGLVGAVGLMDEPTIVNLTFTYKGPTLTTAVNFPADIVISGRLSSVIPSDASSQAGSVSELFPVFVPIGAGVPEPGTLAILSAGLILFRRASLRSKCRRQGRSLHSV